MEQLVKGKSERFRRRHNINFVRYADDFIVTANNREVLEDLIPELEAFLAVRGVSLSKEKTKITPINKGFDFLRQTIRKHPRPNGKPAKLQINPSKASFQSIKEQIRAICKSHKDATPDKLINTLNPVLRGWANYHRHIICAEMFTNVDSFVWGRVYRWSRALATGSKARIHAVQDGLFPACQQMITDEEELILHHRDGKRRN